MSYNTIWITGASGRLGSTLVRYLDPMDAEIIATDKSEVDITSQLEVNTFVERNRPKIIINCSGLTKREECEKDPDQAFLLNAIGAKYIAIAASRIKAKLIHLSTGDVFDGDTLHPYTEIDRPSPTSVYGKSKYIGEQMVKDFAHRYFIVRVSRLYSRENRMVEDILNMAKKTGVVEVAKSQYASPTSVYQLVLFLLKLMETSDYGLYHASCEGYCSMKAFAKEVLDLTNTKADIVFSEDWDNVENEPSFRGLENYILNVTGLFKFNSWQKALEDYVRMEGLNG